MEGLVQCPANYVPLTPISFLERASFVYGDTISIVHGEIKYTWKETYERCLRLASALSQLKISRGDIVAVMAPNIPAMYELHFGVPMAGAILSALNISLDAPTLAVLLKQLEAKIIFVDHEHIDMVFKVIKTFLQAPNQPILVVINECNQTTASNNTHLQFRCLDYDSLMEIGAKEIVGFNVIRPKNECDPISVNFTSGSTGTPKAVVYSHRAAYLNSLAGIFRLDMRRSPIFLWTVDMFRCNGWCYIWVMAALGGTNICLRHVTTKVIFDSISLHKVTHICGKPILLDIIAKAPIEDLKPLPWPVDVIIAGVLPASRIILRVKKLGFNVIYGYGMTEAMGPAIITPLDMPTEEEFSSIEMREFQIKQRDGMYNVMIEGIDVKDPITMKSIPNDGKTMGEVMFKGNTLMMGYLKNAELTQAAFKGEWYRTGDIGIKHPDGQIQMKDRAKDIIICGIDKKIVSTIDVEAVLASHPKVSEVAVVGKQDDRLGQVPIAFVKLKNRSCASCEEIKEFCVDKLEDYMVPKSVIFGDLPINSTGKIQKFVLREWANTMGSNGHLH